MDRNWEWWCLPTTCSCCCSSSPYLKNRIATVPEFLTRRFGPLCGDIYSWVMLVAYVLVFLAPVLYGGSLVFSELTGWDFRVTLWGTVILVGLYTVRGGLASVMWTVAVQCVFLLGADRPLLRRAGKSPAAGPR
jgi:SSS family solute:Na+ symporter